MNRLLLISLAVFCKITVCNSQVVDIVWEKSFGGFNSDEGFAICGAVDSGYVFLGYSASSDGDVTFNAGQHDVWVVHTDVDGNIIWQKSYGGSGNDEGLSIIKTVDSGYVIGGRTISSDGDVGINYGNNDCWIIKLNSDGDLLWNKVIGGSLGEEAISIIQVSDGGFIFTGYSNSDDGIFSDHIGSTEYKDLIIVKLNSEGETEWSNSYGGYSDDRGYKIIQIADSNYVVVGATEIAFATNYWIIKIDPEGNLLWEKDYGGSEDEIAFAVAEINPNRLVVTGEAESSDGDITEAHGSNDAWTIMLNATGDLIWEKALGGTHGETGKELLTHSDGSITIAGWAGSDNNGDVYGHQGLPGHGDYWIINLDSSGIIRWQRCLGGYESDFANAALLASDSSILLTGYALSDDGDVTGHHGEPGPFSGPDAWSLKVKVNCNLLAYYPDTDGDSFGASGGYIYSCIDTLGYVFNNTDCDDANAEINPAILVDPCNSIDDNCNGVFDEDALFLTWYIDADSDGYGNGSVFTNSCLEFIAGYVLDSTDCNDTNPDIYPGAEEISNGIDDDCNQLIDEGISINENILNSIKVYPNPTVDILFVEYADYDVATIEIINISGQILWKDNIVSALTEIDVSKFTSGIYLLKIITSNGEASLYFVKE
ncbi:MAG: T9SS type A sorting domain-containing protein [Bacteroidetes bacterium]|nr:T9SS type A sorting domain-containing protein [Bacteroidota bacterium]